MRFSYLPARKLAPAKLYRNRYLALACYFLAMKTKKGQKAPITGPLIKGVVERQKADTKKLMEDPSIGSAPLDQPDLYQDPGSGYNPDFTFPQD